MLKPLLGSDNRERILLYLAARPDGYPRAIARFFKTDLAPVQAQLDRLEEGGVVASRMAGRTRLYTFNPRYPFREELGNLLRKALDFLPDVEREALLMDRRRPRRRGKPL